MCVVYQCFLLPLGTEFEKKTGDGPSKTLEEYIHHIAKTGDTIFPWHRIRHFMQHMLETVRGGQGGWFFSIEQTGNLNHTLGLPVTSL